MGKKLYCVKVVMYVMAENTSEACLEATRAQFDIFECGARRANHLHTGWEDAIPYNADDERTCAEILASEQAPTPASPLPYTASVLHSTLRLPMQPAVAHTALH